MKIINDVSSMQQESTGYRANGRKIGFVPTMGALHAGHMSLVEHARKMADVVVVSIFVNPIQFGPNEDIDRYPRTFDRDSALCGEAGVDCIFAPTPEGLYAPDRSVFVDEHLLSAGLCGASRPGHFRGVATVVAKLFNIVQPHLAVFGQKDAQQLRIIQRMVRDLNFPVEIVGAPIVREPDGLAMSSRNTYLSAGERKSALCLSRALQLAEAAWRKGERDAGVLRSLMAGLIEATPLTSIDYIEIVDDRTLKPLTVIDSPALIALAVRVGKTRLIDNAVLGDIKRI